MFSMLLFVKFVHVIAAMVFFGLPFAFGRWYAVFLHTSHADTLHETLRRMKTFTFLHLNLCALILIITGLYLGITMGLWPKAIWLHISLTLSILAIINLNANLGLALKKLHSYMPELPDEQALRATRKRIIIFSALHHTFVTLSVALMIFKPQMG